MPTKKRKYNARFPAGRIKKIMQTDEEVGKVAQAVPIIISITYNNHLKKWELQYRILDGPRTRPIIYSLLTLKGNDLELFVESLLSKAMQVTMSRNAKTLSPSHVKQCILAESKFDFLRDLVKNIPDVSAAEERELMSAESSPNSSRFSDMAVPPRRIAREDSNSSSSSDVKVVLPQPPPVLREHLKLQLPTETEPPHKTVKTETVTSAPEGVIDLSKKSDQRPVVTANFYQETLLTDEVQHRSVITVNPTYTSPQPSTSYTPEPIKLETVPKPFFVEKPLVSPRTPVTPTPRIPVTPTVVTPTTTIPPRTPLIQTPRTPVTPILNIDFTKNFANPEIKLLDTAAVNIVSVPKNEKNSLRQFPRQNSKPPKPEVKKIIIKPIVNHPVDIDSLNSGNLQIDEDYDT